MKPNINNLILAIKRSGMEPPTEIVADGKRHKFIAGKDKTDHPIFGYYIAKEGFGLYWSKGLGISNKVWSNKKLKLMRDSEKRHYKKIKQELLDIQGKAKFTAQNSSNPDKHESKRPQPVDQSNKMTKTVAKQKDQAIQEDRIARRLLNDCCTVIGTRNKVKTHKLLVLLNSSEEMPWHLFNTGSPIGIYHLSKLLKKFDIKSHNILFKRGVARGYCCEQFTDAVRHMEALPES